MNKRLGSDLRCYYDSEECTLRVVCMEDRDETQIVVLYALRVRTSVAANSCVD